MTRTLIDDGWRVVVPWYEERELARVDEHERLDLVQADLTDPASAAEVVARAGRRRCGALVNLVGGFAQGERVHETPVDDFERRPAAQPPPDVPDERRGAARVMRGGGGAIVCVSARAALQPFPGAAGYITAKAAVLAFVDVLARRVPRRRHPHERHPALDDRHARQPRESSRTPTTTRGSSPAEIARVIAHLCSDDAGVTSGGHIPVYGRA